MKQRRQWARLRGNPILYVFVKPHNCSSTHSLRINDSVDNTEKSHLSPRPPPPALKIGIKTFLIHTMRVKWRRRDGCWWKACTHRQTTTTRERRAAKLVSFRREHLNHLSLASVWHIVWKRNVADEGKHIHLEMEVNNEIILARTPEKRQARQPATRDGI